MQSKEATTGRARWNGWTLHGVRRGDERHAPTIRLVLPVRLWDDDVALDYDRMQSAWTKFMARMNGDALVRSDGRDPLPIWESPQQNDRLLHELAPAPRELCGLDGGMRIWRMTRNALKSPKILGDAGGRWGLECRGHEGEDAIPASITGIGCWASSEGLAYVILDLEMADRPGTDRATTDPRGRIDDFLDVLHHARFLHGGGVRLVREQQVHPSSGRTSPADMELLGKSAWKPTDTPGCFRVEFPLVELMDGLFRRITGRRETDRGRASLGNPNALHAYALVDVRAEDASLRCDEARRSLVLQIAEMAPASRDVRRTLLCDEPDAGVRAFEYSENAYFACSPECTVFVSIDQADTQFWQETMPGHVLGEYFSIQILTMYQRHVVDEVRRLAGARSQPGMSEAQLDRRWESVQQRAQRAKAHGFFIEVSMRTNHARFESMLRQTLHVDRAYETAMGLVDALCETQIARVEMRREQDSRRREERWQTIAGFTILPTIGLTILNINMDGVTVREDGMTWWAVLVLVLLFALLGFLLTCAARAGGAGSRRGREG